MDWSDVQAYLHKIQLIVNSPVELVVHGRVVDCIAKLEKGHPQTRFVIQKTGGLGRFITQFDLVAFPGCCAFLISTNVVVSTQYRNMGINTLLNKLRQDIAREWGYTALICTDIKANEPERRVLYKNRWKDIFNIRNKRTGNDVFISVKEL